MHVKGKNRPRRTSSMSASCAVTSHFGDKKLAEITKRNISDELAPLLDTPSQQKHASVYLVAGSSAVRTNNEINSWSKPLFAVAADSCPKYQGSAFIVRAGIAPSAEKFDNQQPRAASFLFARRGTRSYDEFIAGVPLRPRPSMMLGMINTSDIFSIGENASACA
jgi:hypothetical protein